MSALKTVDDSQTPRSKGERDAYTHGVERIAADRVSKTVGATAQIEFHKAQAISRALAGSQFGAPEALSCFQESGRIEFQFIPNARRLQDVIEERALDGTSDVFELNIAAGQLLAILHRNLKLPQSQRWSVPKSLSNELARAARSLPEADDVFLHCDFSPVNVLVTDAGGLFVIDAAPNDYFTYQPDLVGPRYVDLATYTTRLYWPYRARAFKFNWRRVIRRLRDEFIRGYEDSSSTKVDRAVLQMFERAVLRERINWKTKSALVRWPMIAIGERMLPAD